METFGQEAQGGLGLGLGLGDPGFILPLNPTPRMSKLGNDSFYNFLIILVKLFS